MYEDENYEEFDLVQATDEDGNQLTLRVLDYFFYNGEEYAALEEAEEECDMACEGCEHAAECEAEEEDEEAGGIYICKVVSSTDEDGTEMDEFSPVEDDALADKLLEIFNRRVEEDDELATNKPENPGYAKSSRKGAFCIGNQSVKQGGGEITLAGIGKDRDDRFAFAQFFGETERGGDIGAAGDAAEDAFLTDQASGGFECLVIGDDIDLIVDLHIQIGWNQTVANAHLKMRADASAGENSGIFRFYGPNADIGVEGLERFTDAAERAAGADAGAEAVDRLADLLHDLKRGMVFMDKRIVRVFKLLGDPNGGILAGHAQRSLEAFLDAGTDITIVVDQDQFCAVAADQLTPFLADTVRHDNTDLVAPDSADERQTDALVAAGGLDNDGILGDLTALFGFADHIVSGARFDAAADVDSFIFNKDFSRTGRNDLVQPDDRCMSDCFQYIVIDHIAPPLCFANPKCFRPKTETGKILPSQP